MRGVRFLLFFVILLFSMFSMAAESVMDEFLRVRLRSLKQDTEDVKTLREVGFHYLQKGDYDQAIVYGEKLLAMSDENDDEYSEAGIYAHTCLGQAYIMKGDVELAYRHMDRARYMGEKFGKDSVLCSIYNGLGIFALFVQKDYYEATTYMFKGIEVAKRCKYDNLRVILLTNLSAAYYYQSDTTGLKYALESYELSHKLKNPHLICSTSVNVAYFYYIKGDYQNALNYLQEGEFTMLQNNFFEQASIYSLFGNIMHKLGKDEEAMDYYNRTLALDEYGDASAMANAYLGAADIFMSRRQYDEAIRLLEIGINSSYHRTSSIYRADLQKSLSDCYEQMGSPVEALKWYKVFQAETDSLYNAEKERIVEDLRTKYDVERQEQLVRQQRLELIAKEQRMALVLVILFFVILVAVLLYYLYNRKNGLYLAIVKQNQEAIRREVNLQKQILRQETELANLTAKQSQSEKYAASSLTDEKKQDLFLRLESLLRNEKIYCDNMLTKEKVAEMLGTNRTYLSQIINEQTKQTFTQFVNGFRAQEAVRLLSDPNNQTPLKAIVSDLGFNSMTTFYNLFQATTGMTPSQYRNKVQELKNDL